MNDAIRTYELRFEGGRPGVDIPEGGLFDTQEKLLARIEEVHEGEYGPLAMADGSVTVYQGGDVDPTQGTNTVIGYIDAHVAHISGGFEEEDLKEWY
jgi:hypothetical protein